MTHIAIVGAGQAGSSAAFKLRSLGFSGAISLVGDEPVQPYQRPLLSKGYLLGEITRERLFLRPTASYAENDIRLMLSTTVDALDSAGQHISVSGEDIHYDKLILTTGSSPHLLPAAMGGDLGGVYAVRKLADIDAMAAKLEERRNVLIVGGGYIGLEAAAVCAKMGLRVTVVEMAERILQRVAAAQTSDYFRTLHQSRGVEVIEGVGLSHLRGDGSVTGAELTDGQTRDIDMVLVGIGIRPNTALAELGGLRINNGIETDAFGRTSAPNIWAAGDCASFPFKGERIRLESVPNAIAQAEAVAANIMGAQAEYVATPWFWSDQFDVKLQIAGLNAGYDRIVVREGVKAGSVSHWYYRGSKLLAVDAMKAPREFMVGRRLIEQDKSPEATVVSDPQTDLRSLM